MKKCFLLSILILLFIHSTRSKLSSVEDLDFEEILRELERKYDKSLPEFLITIKWIEETNRIGLTSLSISI